MAFNTELIGLNSEQHQIILKNILNSTIILNDQTFTNFKLLNAKLTTLNFLSNETIKMICSKQIDLEFIKLILNTDQSITTKDLNTPRASLFWGYERKLEVNGYKFLIRWSWWTYISLFWNLEADDMLVELIGEAGSGSATAIGEVIVILTPILSIPILGLILGGVIAIDFAAVSAVWLTVNKGNGVYGDFEVIIPGKTVASTYDWSNW